MSQVSMNVQPVYPSRTAGGGLMYFHCVNCGKECNSGNAFADLNGKRGAYYCPSCTNAHLLLHGVMVERLNQRDLKELRGNKG